MAVDISDIGGITDNGSFTFPVSVAAGEFYLIFVTASQNENYASSVSASSQTATKIYEFDSNSNTRIAAYSLPVNATVHGLALSNFVTGTDIGQRSVSVVKITGGKTSQLAAHFVGALIASALASSGTAEGVDLTPPDESGAFLSIAHSRLSSSDGSNPAITPSASFTELRESSWTQDSGQRNRIHIAKKTGNTSLTTVDCDLTFTSTFGATIEVSQILLWLPDANATPEVPTNLERIGSGTDTTPAFEADLNDIDFLFSESARVRFEIETLGGSPVGNISSGFVSSAQTVSAEYTSALSVGQYRVRARAEDDSSANSSYTSYVNFNVTQLLTKDLNIPWDVNVSGPNVDLSLLWNVLDISKELALLWNVAGVVSINLELLWNTLEETDTKDLSLLWEVIIAWSEIELDDTIWSEVVPP